MDFIAIKKCNSIPQFTLRLKEHYASVKDKSCRVDWSLFQQKQFMDWAPTD